MCGAGNARESPKWRTKGNSSYSTGIRNYGDVSESERDSQFLFWAAAQPLVPQLKVVGPLCSQNT